MYKPLLLLIGFMLTGAYAAYFIQSDIKIEEGSLPQDVYFYNLFVPYKKQLSPKATQLDKLNARDENRASQYIIKNDLLPTAITGGILALFLGIYPAIRFYRGQSVSTAIIIALLVLYAVLSLWLRIKMEKPYF